MTPVKTILLCILVLLLAAPANHARATHIVGGDITYDHLGNDDYRITLRLYVDCINGSPDAIAGDAFSKIGVFNNAGTLIQSLSMTRTGPSRIIGQNYSCVVPPTNACVDLYVFTTTTNLPPTPGGYSLVFQRCCRNGTITNIINPGVTGSTYRTFIPNRHQTAPNSSARFFGQPPNFLCKDEPLEYDHSAVDPDGDSLVYRLVQPLHGASQSDPAPMPENFTAQVGVTWRAGYTTVNQMTSNPPMSIDPVSGLLKITPAAVGQFVVGIAVDEYRNGQVINTVFRDFQFNVLNCNFDVKAQFGPVYGECSDTVKFNNASTGSISRYRWHFGLSEADTSNATHPQFVYPGPGKYLVTLDAISNLGCKNTKTFEIHILDDIDGLSNDTMVCHGAQVQLGNPGTEPGISWLWSPPDGLNSSTIPNPVATVTEDRDYTVRKSGPSCYVEGEVSVKKNPIVAGFYHEYLPPCDGLRVKFFAQGKNYNSIEWDFGDPVATDDQATSDDTAWFYQDTGIVYVRARVSNEFCTDSVIKPIRIIFPGVFTAVIDTAICNGDQIRIGPLNDTSILSFVWSTDSFMSSDEVLYPDVTPTRSISYVLTKTYAHCTQRDSFSVQVNEIPNFTITKSRNDRLCPGDTVELSANGNYQFEWFPKTGVFEPFSPVTLVVPDSSRWYTLVALTAAQCADTAQVYVELFPIWEVDLDPDYVVCKDHVFLPELDIPDAQITWRELGGDGFTDSIRKEGVFVVNVVTQCQNLFDTFNAFHYTPNYCVVEFPNSFTPNGDGLNDTYPYDGNFRNIFGTECEFDSYNLIIFNRWGEIVFRSDTPTEDWDGTYKGNGGTQDVYGYYLTYREFDWCKNGYVIRVKRGNITVLH